MWDAQTVERIRAEVKKDYGKGWNLLSVSQQQGAMALAATSLILGQLPSAEDTIKLSDIQDVIRRVVHHAEFEQD